MKPVDFLRDPSDKRLRKEISNIRDSYSHPWDAPAELIQNAVDAIYAHARDYPGVRPDGYHVTVELNSRTKSLTVSDDGVGIAASNLTEALAPHSTLKDDLGPDTIGQKGVGLTYTVFASNRYELESTTVSSHVRGYVAGGALWVNGSGEMPSFEPQTWEETPNDPTATGKTSVF